MDREPPSPTAITSASSDVSLLAGCSGTASSGGARGMPGLLGRAEDGAEAGGRQTRCGMERRPALAVDEGHARADVWRVASLLQNANYQIDRELRLDRRLVGRRGDD